MIRWQEPRGGVACSPSSPSQPEKLHEATYYLKWCANKRENHIFHTDIQEQILESHHMIIVIRKDRSSLNY